MTGKKSSSSSGSGGGGGGGGRSSQSSHSQNTRSGGTGQPQKSDYAVIKDGGFRNMHHFMTSYGIKPGNEGSYEEGKAILDGLRESSKQ